MPNDLNTLFDRIRALPDRELVALLEEEADQYTREAISIAEIEAEARGGILYLKQEQEQALVHLKQPPEKDKHLFKKLLSKLIGRGPSEKYPGLGYLSTAMRLISFLLLLLAFISSVGGFYNFLFGEAEWWWSPVGWLQPIVGFILFYGGSELINVVLDIEKNTRQSGTPQKEDPNPPIR